MKRFCGLRPEESGTIPDGDLHGAQLVFFHSKCHEGGRPAVPMDDFSVAEESEFHIVRTKRFSVKPMSPEEAILQMNLLDHDFYVFRNSDDDSISIVYHRKNGGYGLIVTDEEE